jgi:hypothetical protein
MVLLLVSLLVVKQLLLHVVDFFTESMPLEVIRILLLLILLKERFDFLILDLEEMLEFLDLGDEHISLIVVGVLSVTYLCILVQVKLGLQ